MLTLTRGTDILFDKLRAETEGVNLKNNLCAMPPSFGEWGFHAKLAFFFNIFSSDPHTDGLIIGLY